MIVQCPSCASRYRIRDANIPPSGGKIRCPSCSHAFIVYPEASEDEDRTNITSKNEISNLINQMAGERSGLGAQDEDYVSTQIASSAESRAAQAMANELGDPMDMDGTVEIQNPMHVWKQAQEAMKAAQQQAPAEEDDDEWDDFAATEVVDPSKLSFPGPPQPQNPLPPTAEVSREELADAFGVAATSGMFPAAPSPHDAGPPTVQHPAVGQQTGYPSQFDSNDDYGSGPYPAGTPNTPPGGRSTHESWDQMQQPSQTEPHEQVNAFANPPEQAYGQQPSGFGEPQTGFGDPQHRQPEVPRQQWGSGQQSGFQRSPSGLTSAALFDDPIPADDPVNSSVGLAQPSGAELYGQPAPQQPAPQQPVPQQAAAPDGAGEHPGPWKLRTNFGLTYEFPDTKGLRSWLSSREELDGFTVSADDGGSFHPLSAFPHLLSNARSVSRPGSVPQPQSHGSGSFNQPPQFGWGQPTPAPNPAGSGLYAQSDASNQTKGVRVNNEYRPPSRESKGRGLLWFVFLLLLAAAVLIALETTGVFKISNLARDLGVLPAATVDQPVDDPADPAEAKPEVPELDPEKLAEKQAADVEALLEDTQRLVEGNKLPTALQRLDKLEQLAPDNPLVFDLRAQVLDKLGKADEAAEARATASELRGITDTPDAGGADQGTTPSDESE